jgi:undecaprenyl-diphosphatase
MTLLSIRRFSERVRSGELIWIRRANRLSQGRLTWRFFATVSWLGNGWFWYALIVALAVAGGPAGQLAALQMAAVGIVSLVLYKALKRWSRRPRPLAVTALTVRVAPLDEFSFPSGHTLHAVGFTLVAVAHLPLLGWLLWPFSAAVAASRVVLGLHYPSDVIAAIVLGWGLSDLSFRLLPGVV